MGVAAEVHHIADGGGYRAVDVGHDEHTQEVEHRAGQDGCPDVDAPGGDASGDGVGGIRPSVDENDAQRQQDCDQHGRAGKDLLYK